MTTIKPDPRFAPIRYNTTPPADEPSPSGSDKRLVRPVEIKRGMQVTDLLDSQNLSNQKRKQAKASEIATLADAWPNANTEAPPRKTPNQEQG